MRMSQEKNRSVFRNLFEGHLEIFKEVRKPVTVATTSARVPMAAEVERVDVEPLFYEMVCKLAVAATVLGVTVHDEDMSHRVLCVVG